CRAACNSGAYEQSPTNAACVSAHSAEASAPVRTLILRTTFGQTARVHRQTLIDRPTLDAFRRGDEALLARFRAADLRAPKDDPIVAPAGVTAVRIGDLSKTARVGDSVDQTGRFGARDITSLLT